MALCKDATVEAAAVAVSTTGNVSFLQKQVEQRRCDVASSLSSSLGVKDDVEVDLREVYFLIMHFLSSGPCKRATVQLWNELLEHKLLPRRYHAWHSRTGLQSGDEDDDGSSFPLNYIQVVERNPEVEGNHLVKLLWQQLINCRRTVAALEPPNSRIPTAADIPTLLGLGQFSLLDTELLKGRKPIPWWMIQLRWPHWQSHQVYGLALREIGGGFARHHCSPSIRAANYAIAKPSTLVDRIQIIKKFRGHRNAVYCAIFDSSGQYVITGSDDRLVKIWSTETGFCLCSCRGHEGDITDLAVSSGNALVASASNDCTIRVWRLPDGLPVSVLRGHIGGVTAIAFSPRQGREHHLLSSSDDGTCRIWDARDSSVHSRVYMPKPDTSSTSAKPNAPTQLVLPIGNQILCCAFNADGSTFVTGSSDRLARVWDARKWNDEMTGKPNHELDILRGHENDVNYVQFSGCAGPVKPFPADTGKEERSSKFKNSWFAHENIVTCSRDGSAIIWTHRIRRSLARAGRWLKAYHLRVPPPPMPPQPPRGAGPRQRLLPTPRGVNMIVWSLDNRFVLAAIMDCRICVWNAVDGSLVHSLTGHVKSTYVLDVHPFNPRIAMSAGYDGRVIIWDIWEGRPVRVYETGEYNLVDGNFSPDGTSVVVSDEVGQIYLLATGQGESQKDAKYDQFFLGDFRPLVRDSYGNVLDQEMHLPPHQRNIQDLLCDASMIPYAEPYQSMYQQRRLGALGIDWRPPSVNLAVGTIDDIVYTGIGDNPFAFNPLIGSSSAGMERHRLDGSMRWVEQSAEIDEAMDWEQEAARLSDDSGSDYTASEESLSDVDDEEVSATSIKGSTNSEDAIESRDETTEETHLRRSGRNKRKAEGMAISSFGKRMRRQQFASQETDEESLDLTDKRSVRRRSLGPSVVRVASQQLSTRPKRLAAKNALQFFSHISTHEDEDEDEHISTQADRYASSLERVPESDKSLQSIGPKGIEQLEEERQNNESTEEMVFEYAKSSELGEFSRRPRSQRRYGLNMQFHGARLTESDSRGSGEDKVDALFTGVAFNRTEGSETLAPNPVSVVTNQIPLKRLAVPCDVRYDGYDGLSDTCDNDSDSNDIVNEIETLKALHSDEVQLLEPCNRSPTDEQRTWKCKQVPDANESKDRGGHIVFPLEGRHDNLSCSSDRSASNYNGCQDSFGKSVWGIGKSSVLDRIHDSEASTVGRFMGIDTSKGLVEDSNFPRIGLEDKSRLDSMFYGLSPDTKASRNCVQRGKVTDSKSLKVPFSQSDLLCRKVCTERQIITRSEASGRRHMSESHKEPPLGRILDIAYRVVDKAKNVHKLEELGEDSMPQLHELHNGSSSQAVANNSLMSEINGRRLRDRGLLVQPSLQNLEDHEKSPCLQPDDRAGGNTYLIHNFPKKSVVRTRGVSKQKIPIVKYEEDSHLGRKVIVNGLAQSKVQKQTRPDISGHSLSNSHQDNETWLKSESDKEAENARQNVRHKRRTLGELHSHSLIGSLDSMHQNSSEDFMSKRRIRHMRSVMSEGGKDTMLKISKEKKALLNRAKESPATAIKRELTGVEMSPWSDNNDCQRKHCEAKYKDDTYEGNTGDRYRGVSTELDRIQSVDSHGAEEDVSFPNERRRLRVSNRVRRDISRRDPTWDRDHGRFSDLHLLSRERGIRTRKSSSWLMLSEVEEGTRYIPQFGDEVVYLRQGHQEFLESHKKYDPGPWMSYGNIIQAIEFCHVTELEYAILPESGDTFCKLTLEFTNVTSKVYGNTFRLSLPELTDFPDFLVEKSRYDAAIQRNWTSRDKCKVWWRSEDGKGGSWWEGRVISVKPKSSEFPDSPWERFVVQYRADTSGPHTHSPWELFDSKGPKWGFPCIDEDMKSHLSFALGKLESSAEEPDDEFGIRRLRQVVCRVDFINRVPLPLTLDIIKLRIEKNYYHSLEAFSFDVHLLVTNAKQYYGAGSEMAEKMARVAQHLLGTFSDNSTCMS